jgi:hypothetical protein
MSKKKKNQLKVKKRIKLEKKTTKKKEEIKILSMRYRKIAKEKN